MNADCKELGYHGSWVRDHTAGGRLVCVRCSQPEPARRNDAVAFRRSPDPTNPKTIT